MFRPRNTVIGVSVARLCRHQAKLQIDGDAETFGEAFNPGFAIQVGKLLTVQHEPQLRTAVVRLAARLMRNVFLGRSHVEFKRGKIHMRGMQHGFDLTMVFGMSNDVIKVGAGHFNDALNVYNDQIHRDQIGGGRPSTPSEASVRTKRMHKTFAVHASGVLEHLEYGFATGQVQIGDTGPELEIQIKDANPRRVFIVDVGLPKQGSRPTSPGATGHALHRITTPLRSPVVSTCSAFLARRRPVAVGPIRGQCIAQFTFGQWIRYKFIATFAQKSGATM
jgi:hypothetical protein